MSFPRQQKEASNNKPKLFPCVICQKPTDQTCSLCRKVFYCSAQHQQIDWHMKHKMECEGKIVQNVSSGNQQWNTYQTQFNSSKDREYFFSDTRQIENKSNQIRLENESKQFMTIFQERLVLRKKCVDLYLKFVTNNTKTNDDQLASLFQELNQISQNLLRIFRNGFIPILEQMYGITTSEFILKLDQILDKSLQAKYHLLIHKHQQVRRYLFAVNEQIPLYPNSVDSRFRQIYENVLKTIIKISEAHCNDKVTEGMMAKYIVLIEKFDGIWEQVYGYFNMGNWYLKKTYYQKSIKCFNHSLELLNAHKVRDTAQGSSLVRADLMFNISICKYSLAKEKQAFDIMQESYRLRTNAVGKNAIQSSECLQCLSQWAFRNKDWEDCLQYAKQCYRVRKLNVNYPQHLESIQKLLEDIYKELRRQKQRSEQQMSVKPPKYYENLISPITKNEQKFTSSQPQQSFIKQLNASRKEDLIAFKIVVTPEMAQTYSSNQWQKLTKLLDMTDKMMERQQIRRIIFQSQFTQSLKQNQKDTFIKLNRVD